MANVSPAPARSRPSSALLRQEPAQPSRATGPEAYLASGEEAYIKSRGNSQQLEIFDAQDAWDEILGPKRRPSAPKLDEILEELRNLGYAGAGLAAKFRICLEKTQASPGVKDPVAWVISALRGAPYP